MHFIPIRISLRFALTDSNNSGYGLALNYYMNYCWPWSLTPYSVTSLTQASIQAKILRSELLKFMIWSDLMLRHLIKYQNVVIFTYQLCCVALVCFLARFPPCPAPSCAFYAYACASVRLVSADGIVQEAATNKKVSYHINTFSIMKIHVPISNTLRPRQNGCQFPDDNFKHIFLNENI